MIVCTDGSRGEGWGRGRQRDRGDYIGLGEGKCYKGLEEGRRAEL